MSKSKMCQPRGAVMASALIRHTPILDEAPEDRRVALTKRLPSLSNYLATDVSAWAWHMTIVRDNELWRETDAVSWEDYCTRIVGKPLDWCVWIIGGYEALRGVRPGPIPEGEALERGKAAEVARQNPITEGDALRTARAEGGKLGGRPAKGEENLHDNIRKVAGEWGTGKGYLLRRLAAQAPDILDAYGRGEHRSVRAAALAAGIVKPPDALRDLCRAWEKTTDEQRKAFVDGLVLDWLNSRDTAAADAELAGTEGDSP
jgi:hypothetical protein